MTEEEFETESVKAEVIPSQLQMMIIESELSKEKSQFIMNQFSDHFKLASDWAKQAKGIVVTNEKQKDVMKQAREGRLVLRERRLEIEKARKFLKEQSLREGQAIDKIANFLKNMIIPTEEHLERQEKFIELKKAAEEEAKRVEIEKRIEEERLIQEKKKAEEAENLRRENEKIRKESEEKERLHKEELRRVHEKNEKILRIEREKSKKAEEEAREKHEEEINRLSKESGSIVDAEFKDSDLITDSEKLIILRANITSIYIPEVTSYEAVRMVEEVKSHLYLAVSRIKPIINEEEY